MIIAFSVFLHTFLPYFICYLLGLPLWIKLIMGLQGSWPDISRYAQKDYNDWNDLYKWSHEWKWWLILLPAWALHVGMDSFVHTEEKRKYEGKWFDKLVPDYYKWWIVPLELLIWVVMFIIYRRIL